ncbi:hypothetical protein, partial [Prevotella sp. P5-64]|uniref:hypothetical protein n=1 Tax=Prevotella sp. P5-64 TaxID=2024226 RepID=UPI001C1FD702
VEVRSCFTLVDDIGSTAQTVRTPGNSVGVAISQPRVEVRSASTLGIGTKKVATLNRRSPARRFATRKGKLLRLAVGVTSSRIMEKKGVDDYY